jgi:hypothetical protein
MSQPSPLKRISSRDSGVEEIDGLVLKVGLEEIREIMLKIGFGFPCGLFFGVMVPLNLVHSNGSSSSTFFFGI